MSAHKLDATALQAARETAAQLLIRPPALVDVSLDDARDILACMDIARLDPGTLLVQQGEYRHNDYLLMIVEGEATVTLDQPSPQRDDLVLSVVGPGAIVGAMGVLDGDPRSANVLATTEMIVAGMTRSSLARMIEQHPRPGSRFLLAMCVNLSDRLRNVTRQMQAYARINRTLMEQIDVSETSRDQPSGPAQ